MTTTTKTNPEKNHGQDTHRPDAQDICKTLWSLLLQSCDHQRDNFPCAGSSLLTKACKVFSRMKCTWAWSHPLCADGVTVVNRSQ